MRLTVISINVQSQRDLLHLCHAVELPPVLLCVMTQGHIKIHSPLRLLVSCAKTQPRLLSWEAFFPFPLCALLGLASTSAGNCMSIVYSTLSVYGVYKSTGRLVATIGFHFLLMRTARARL